MRMLVRLNLDRTDDIEVVGEASSGAEAIERIAELAPDLVLLDQLMPGLTGIEMVKRLDAEGRRGDVRIVMFSAVMRPELIAEAEAAGIDRCLSKDDFARVAATVREVAGG